VAKVLDGSTDGVKRAVEILKEGGLVAFPTETVYGLGCDALDENAVRRVFEVKKRPLSKPLIVGVSEIDEVYKIAEVTGEAERLMKEFFPGPLTIVLRKKLVIPSIVTAGMNKVAVRMPDHEIPLKLAKKLGRPIVVPSANKTGKPSPTTYKHVLEDLGNEIDAVIVGECSFGIESTIVDLTVRPARVLRTGAVKVNELRKSIDVVVEPQKDEIYTISSPVYVFVGERAEERVREFAERMAERGMKVAVIARRKIFENTIILGESIEKYSSKLFSAVREAELLRPDLIVIEGIEEEGIMDRLRRLAGEKIFRA
jgi:L-threonylcarbamoyladenylate synthase